MSNSFAVVSAQKVQIACEKYLAARIKRIERDSEALIEAELNRRFFKAKTREDALSRCAESIDMLKWTGGYWARRVEDMLKLATLSSDGFVNLNADDASILGDYIQ